MKYDDVDESDDVDKDNVDVDEDYAKNKCGLRSGEESVSAQLQQISQLPAAASVFTFLSSASSS